MPMVDLVVLTEDRLFRRDLKDSCCCLSVRLKLWNCSERIVQ